ncbi:hypothetical protein [Natrinema sp. SYSU A 869]|uniref:hypothetical protein n=1 Tax=Natrinema sp. SYSU A 869 TaxID=2871694 RepID=UPI001CA3E5A1|nr:hypothetical protein [Natrinema sp. SYSU A 869]
MRRRQRSAVCLLAVVAVLVVLTATVAADGSAVKTTIDETEAAANAMALADQTMLIAAGGALLGIGFGAAVASGITYWYKNREIGGRLQ